MDPTPNPPASTPEPEPEAGSASESHPLADLSLAADAAGAEEHEASDSVPLADLSQAVEAVQEQAESQAVSDSVPLADLSETALASETAPASGSEPESVPQEERAASESRGPQAAPLRDESPPGAEAQPAAPAESGSLPREEPEPKREPEASPPAPLRTSPLLVLWPALIPPAAVLLLLAVGVPQSVLTGLGGADPLEPNDTIAQAASVDAGTTGGLRCERGDVDWFRVSVPAGRSLQLHADPPGDEGFTSIHALDGRLLVSSASGDTRCTWTPPDLGAASVLVRVYGERAEPYDLQIDLTDPRVRFEPNDGPLQAANVELGAHAYLLCDGDDWFRVSVPARRPLVARLSEAAAGCGVSIHTTAKPSSSAGALEATLPAVSAQRTVYVRVSGSGTYTLDLRAGPRAPDPLQAPRLRELTRRSDQLEPNDSQEQAQPLLDGTYDNLRCLKEDWYYVDVEANSFLMVDVVRSSRGRNLSTQVLLPGAQGSWSRSGGKKQELRLLSSQATRAWVQVTGDPVRYRLSIRRLAGPPGDLLGEGEYSLVHEDEQLYRIPVKAGQRVTVEATWDPSDGWLDMELRDSTWSDCSDSSEGSSGSRRVSALAKQDGWLFLEPEGGESAFELTVSITSPEERRPIAAPGAIAVGPGVYPDRTLRGEEWLAIPVEEGDTFSASAEFDSSLADIDMAAFDAWGTPLAQANDTGDSEGIFLRASEPGLLYLRTYTYSEANPTFTLTISRNGSCLPLADTPVLDAGEHVLEGLTAHAIRALPVEGASLTARVDLEGVRLSLHDDMGRELKAAPPGQSLVCDIPDDLERAFLHIAREDLQAPPARATLSLRWE